MKAGLIFLLLTSGLLLVVIFSQARRWTTRQRLIGVTVGLALAIGFFIQMRDTPGFVALMPAVLLPAGAEWQVPLVALVAGICLCDTRLPRWRRSVLAALLVGISLFPVTKIYLSSPPACDSFWKGEICQQTNPNSCSAAAAATLLELHGISAEEDEMARLCLTRSDGTSLAGLYHGVSEKTRQVDLLPHVASLKLADLKDGHHLPAILTVALSRETARREPRYEKQWGWQVGQSHSVVLLGFTEAGDPIVGDPSVGQEVWNIEGLTELWTGTALWLESAK